MEYLEDSTRGNQTGQRKTKDGRQERREGSLGGTPEPSVGCCAEVPEESRTAGRKAGIRDSTLPHSVLEGKSTPTCFLPCGPQRSQSDFLSWRPWAQPTEVMLESDWRKNDVLLGYCSLTTRELSASPAVGRTSPGTGTQPERRCVPPAVCSLWLPWVTLERQLSWTTHKHTTCS